jgi:hypothetical protein
VLAHANVGFLGRGTEGNLREMRGLLCEKEGVLLCQRWKSWWRGKEEPQRYGKFIQSLLEKYLTQSLILVQACNQAV